MKTLLALLLVGSIAFAQAPAPVAPAKPAVKAEKKHKKPVKKAPKAAPAVVKAEVKK